MSDAPARPAPPSLEDLSSRSPISLFLDFDGTLVEIAPGPEDIIVPPTMSAGLEALSQRLDGRLALVSGRSLDNIASHLGPTRVARSGSHGAERRYADGSLLGEAPGGIPAEAVEAIADFASANAGVEIERKAHGAALHYRAAPDTEPAVLALAQGLAGQHGLATKRGKCVVELVRPGADKAGAVNAFMQVPLFAGSMPVFIGDDVTDEDGFLACGTHGGFGIAVGERPSDNARFHLPSPEKVHEWLRL